MKRIVVFCVLILLIIAVLLTCAYIINKNRELKIDIDFSNVDMIKWQKASFLSYDIVNIEDVNRIVSILNKMQGKYTAKDVNKDSIPNGMYELGFYKKDKCIFYFTVISENAIRVNGKRFKLDEKIDLSTIDEIIKKVEKQNVE